MNDLCILRDTATVLRPGVIPILSLSPNQEDHEALRGIIEPDFEVYPARTLQTGQSILRRRTVAVVVCEEDLRPGSWRDILSTTFGEPDSPVFIVTSLHADEALWAEVLNLGAFDLLSKPFGAGEVSRVIASALFHWTVRQEPHCASEFMEKLFHHI
jgi:DNA-binding NtrC family response regulator